MKSRLLMFLLSAIFFFTIFSTSVAADTAGDFQYTVSNGEATITDYTGLATTLDIPATLGSYPVKKFWNNAFADCITLETVTIPNTVTDIGWFAFEGCSSLKSIIIPNSVIKIYGSAFAGCNELPSINIPNSVSSIGSWAFAGCDELSSINIPNSVTEIGARAFSQCSSLTSITIPSSITKINLFTFDCCTKLTSIVIPDSIREIDIGAFYGCSSLTSITIPEGIIKINDSMFASCTKLTSVTIPGSVLELGDDVFNNCDALTSVTIPVSVKKIGEGTFCACDNLTSITIPEGVTKINDSMFMNCPKLTSVTIPNSVTEIGDSVFYNCDALTSVAIPGNINRIGEETFYSCDKLSSLTIPESVTEIGYKSFYSCKSLSSLSIPSNVTYVGAAAFSYCSALSAVAIVNDSISIEKDSFNNCSKLTLYCNDPSTTKDYAIKYNIPYKLFGLFPYGTGPVTSVTLNKTSLILSPGNSSTLTATIFPNGATNKSVTWSSDTPNVATVDNNGKVTAVAAGKSVITVKTKDGNFTDACIVSVAKPKAFTDVPKNQWYYTYVMDLTAKGIISGKEEGIFDPGGTIKRSEFARILASASGDDLTSYNGQTKFNDVSQSAWYAKYVLWAYEKGIVYGTSLTTFSPDAKITRQEMAVMINRYANYKEINLPQTVAKKTFADDKDIAFWSKDAVMAMQQAGIIKGKEGNIFDPNGSATRAEAATMISIFLSII